MHARTLVVHSAYWIYLSAQVTTTTGAGRALSLYLLCLLTLHARIMVVRDACAEYILASSGTRSSRRLSRFCYR